MLETLGDLAVGAFYIGVGSVAALFQSLRSLFDVSFFGHRLHLGKAKLMDSGDNKDISDATIKEEESRGGLKFDLVFSGPTSPPPAKTLPLSPKSMISVENIDNKLKAATDRRLTIEAVRLQQINDKKNRIEEVNQKKQEQDDNFKIHSKTVLEKRIVTAREAREAQIKALLERLREHDQHIADVRKQMEQQTDQLRERSQNKLDQANIKRASMLKELQDKQHEHLMHVQEIRLSRSQPDSPRDSCENTPDDMNENAVKLSG